MKEDVPAGNPALKMQHWLKEGTYKDTLGPMVADWDNYMLRKEAEQAQRPAAGPNPPPTAQSASSPTASIPPAPTPTTPAAVPDIEQLKATLNAQFRVGGAHQHTSATEEIGEHTAHHQAGNQWPSKKDTGQALGTEGEQAQVQDSGGDGREATHMVLGEVSHEDLMPLKHTKSQEKSTVVDTPVTSGTGTSAQVAPDQPKRGMGFMDPEQQQPQDSIDAIAAKPADKEGPPLVPKSRLDLGDGAPDSKVGTAQQSLLSCWSIQRLETALACLFQWLAWPGSVADSSSDMVPCRQWHTVGAYGGGKYLILTQST